MICNLSIRLPLLLTDIISPSHKASGQLQISETLHFGLFRARVAVHRDSPNRGVIFSIIEWSSSIPGIWCPVEADTVGTAKHWSIILQHARRPVCLWESFSCYGGWLTYLWYEWIQMGFNQETLCSVDALLSKWLWWWLWNIFTCLINCGQTKDKGRGTLELDCSRRETSFSSDFLFNRSRIIFCTMESIIVILSTVTDWLSDQSDTQKKANQVVRSSIHGNFFSRLC